MLIIEDKRFTVEQIIEMVRVGIIKSDVASVMLGVEQLPTVRGDVVTQYDLDEASATLDRAHLTIKFYFDVIKCLIHHFGKDAQYIFDDMCNKKAEEQLNCIRS